MCRSARSTSWGPAPGDGAESITVAVVAGTPATANLSLGAGSTFYGTVRDATTATPLANVIVTAVSASDPAVGGSAVTDSSGNYQIPNLPAGTYEIVVVSTDHQNAVLVNRVLAVQNQLLNVNLALASTQVSGTVSGSSGPLANAVITATNANGQTIGQATSASDGSYAITTLPPGTYSLKTSASGYQPSNSVAVTVVQNGSVNGLNFTLSAAAITDRSRVRRTNHVRCRERVR